MGRAKYDELWASGRQSLLAGDLQTDRLPVDGEPRWGLSLVIIPDEQTADRLAAQADEIRAAHRGTHHVYEAPDLHMTITSLEPYRDQLDPQTVAHYAATAEAARDLLAFRVSLRGLGGSAGGVFVQGFDDDTLRPIRVRMRIGAADLHEGNAPPMAFVRDTAHISLSVHRQQTAEPDVAQLVDRTRTVPFGALDGGQVALVEYRARDGLMRMNPLERVR